MTKNEPAPDVHGVTLSTRGLFASHHRKSRIGGSPVLVQRLRDAAQGPGLSSLCQS